MLLGLIVLFAGSKAVLFDTLDPDCFWHLRVAEQLRAEGVGPLTDRLSFGSQKAPWTPYSWLAELAMKALWDAGGYRAAVAAQSLISAGIVALIALACRAGAESAPPYLRATPWACRAPERSRLSAVAATAFGAYLSLAYLSFRPVSAAILLLALIAWLLLRDRRGGERTRALWWVPPITALLVNVHLYAFLVPVWAGALLAGAAWERWTCRAPEDRPQAGRHVRRYALLLLLCAAGCCLTPMLPGVVRTIVHYQTADVMVAGPVIAEMQGFARELGRGGGKAGSLVVAAALLCTIRHQHRLRAGEKLWLLVGVVLLVQLGRYAPLFALIAAPVLAVTLPDLSDRLLGGPLLQATAAGVLLAGLARVALAFPRPGLPVGDWINRHAAYAPGYPARAADFVAEAVPRRAGSPGRLVNEFNWGGYLAWRLGPAYQVLLDGRTQLYSAEFWRATYLGDERSRTRFLAGVRADAAVLPARGSSFRASLVRLGWTSAYLDDQAEVLLPPAPAGLADVGG